MVVSFRNGALLASLVLFSGLTSGCASIANHKGYITDEVLIAAVEPGLDNRESPYLGPVREDALGLMQWIGVNELLTEPVRTLLFSAELSL